MPLSTEVFIQQFYGLTGTTVGDRRKNLFALLKLHGNTEIDLNKLTPRNHLEESLQIDVLIHFKNVTSLINVFKTERPALIKQVLRVDWLWDYIDESIVKELFPKTSFNCKLKIINKLAKHLKNSQQADKIFFLINETYGMYLAAKLLPCCSLELVSANFTSDVVKRLNERQILQIVIKHPSLVSQLLATKIHQRLTYKKMFYELIVNHFRLFEKTFSFSYFTKLGRRATNKFISNHKTEVIDEAPYFYQFLHRKQLAKSMGTDFSQFYQKMFPDSYEDFRNDVNTYLDLLETSQNISDKFALFASTFETRYGGNIMESDIIYKNCRMLELMDEQQCSHVIDRLNVPSSVSLCLKNTNESIPALIKLIKLKSEVSARAQLVGNLVETCRINSDLAALLVVCEYVYKCHRHDNTAILVSFLRTLERYGCYSKLNQQHWFYLGKILKIVVAKDTMWYDYEKTLYEYTYYIYKQKQSLKPVVVLYAKKTVDISCWRKTVDISCWRYDCNRQINLKFHKEYLIALNEVLPEVYSGKDLANQYIIYLSFLVLWNKKHPDDKLSLLDNKPAIEAVIEEWKSDSYNHTILLIIQHILTSKNLPDKSYWASMCFKYKFYSEMNVIEWLIKYEPLLVCDNIELIMDCVLNMYYTQVHFFFFTMSKNYTHLGLPQDIMAICTKVITTPDESDARKKNALTGLSYTVADPQEFIKLLVPYYPAEKVEPDAVVYVMQQSMSRSLGNVIPPSSMFDCVLKFSKGDYTKFIRRSMYLIAFSTNEDRLHSFFKDLNSLAVSVRKHAIYLSFRVLDRSSIYNIVKRNTPDRNTSIRKFLLRSIFNLYVKNPDEYLWNMLLASIKNVDTEDKEALEVLVQLQKVPVSCLVRYIAYISTIVATLDDKIANDIPDSVYTQLGVDVVTQIIDTRKCGDLFAYKAVTKLGDSTLQLALLEKLIDQHKSTNTAPSFLIGFVDYCSSSKCGNVSLVQKCLEFMNTLKPKHKFIDDCVYLQISKMYTESYVIKKFAEGLVSSAESFVNQYTPLIFYKFCNTVQLFISSRLKDDLLDLIEIILETASSKYSLELAISLLPRTIPTAPRLKLKFDKIIDVFQVQQDPTICLLLSVYLSDIMQQHNVVEEQLTYENKAQYLYFTRCYDSAYASNDWLLQ